MKTCMGWLWVWFLVLIGGFLFLGRSYAGPVVPDPVGVVLVEPLSGAVDSRVEINEVVVDDCDDFIELELSDVARPGDTISFPGGPICGVSLDLSIAVTWSDDSLEMLELPVSLRAESLLDLSDGETVRIRLGGGGVTEPEAWFQVGTLDL